MDEVGRGTSVQDGLALAFSTIHHLITVNKCRALFATHFHELADMLGCREGDRGKGIFGAVRFFCTDVDETEVTITLASGQHKSDSNFPRMDILHMPTV